MISKLIEQQAESATQADPSSNDGDRQDGNHWEEELSPKLTLQRLFEGWDGTFVMGSGVLLPLILLSAFSVFCVQRLTLVFLNHPIETLVEYLLAALTPLITFMVWSSLRKNMISYSVARGIAMGVAVGSSATISAVSMWGALTMSTSNDSASALLGWMVLPSMLACTAAIYVIRKIRNTRDFASSRNRVVTLSLIGVAVAIWAFVGAEGKSFYVRLAEVKAASSVPAEQKEGFNQLRLLYPEREMRIECSDPRAAGLAGLFLPLSNNSQRELYFALTGEPFGFRDIKNNNLASLSDESLARQIVGEHIPGLSMLRSSMNGSVRPDLLLSTVSWTFVFKNENSKMAEARAEIAIPKGAVVNQLTLWNKGEPQEAKFIERKELQDSYKPYLDSGTSIATITDVGQGRMLVSCAGVPADGELKLRMSVVIPMKPDSATTAVFALPKFIASNFDLTGEHRIRLRSPLELSGIPKNLKLSSNAVKEHLITGPLTADNLMGTGLTLTSARSANNLPIVFEDKVAIGGNQKSTEKNYVVRTVTKTPAARPTQLVVVLDGSKAMEKYRNELASVLKSVPADIPTSVILATNDRDRQIEAMPLTQAISDLQTEKFDGGQNNLVAMLKAAEVAGEVKGSAVLWVHGPQPESNREIYIMGQYEARPSFYDFPIQNSYTDTTEFFRNYGEIGPFESVPMSGVLTQDLSRFLSKWKPGSFDYKVSMSTSTTLPKVYQPGEPDVAVLWKKQECNLYDAKNESGIASQIATLNHLVTPKSAAYCFVSDTDSQTTAVVSAGYCERIRVNSLANLEALLNVLANLTEIFGVAVGLVWFVSAVQMHQDNVGNTEQKKSPLLNRGQKITLGVLSITIGLMTPGLINWLFASARDANLFS